ncbi:MAG: sugar phosphate isomerase/epimerase [Lachnospiraceae bacterium]|nr:sugar phosphate isomerase/epimerase [Lachnospiraceae bacterium]
MSENNIKIGTFFHHIRMASAERKESLDETLKWLRGLGYEAAELDADDLDGAELLKDHGIAVSSIYRQYRWRDGIDEAGMMEHIELAKKLGTDRIMAIPGLFSEKACKCLDGKILGAKGAGSGDGAVGNENTDYPGDREDPLGIELSRMIQGMKKLSELAKENGLTLTIEDYDDSMSPIATIGGMKIFLDAIPDLKVAFDTGNFAFSGDDVLDAKREFIGRTRHVHLKDRLWTRTGTGDPKECSDGTLLWPCAVGDGDLPIKEILQELKAVGYDGYAMAEFFGAASYSELIEKSIENLKSL